MNVTFVNSKFCKFYQIKVGETFYFIEGLSKNPCMKINEFSYIIFPVGSDSKPQCVLSSVEELANHDMALIDIDSIVFRRR